MYCRKCGNEIRSGDMYCSSCGIKVAGTSQGAGKKDQKKKGKNWFLISLCALALIYAAGDLLANTDSGGIEPFGPVQEREPVSLMQPEINSAELLPEEPNDGDVLEESSYSNGAVRRSISDYGDVYVLDYRPDGTMLRETILYYNNGAYGGKRVKNCDISGNPTDETERLPDGTLWLYMYYINRYDEQGRPLELAQYNRVGSPLYICTYTYNADGSYTMDMMEYRGPVYEYEFEDNPQGTTIPWTQSTTTFNAEGDLLDQMILPLEGTE